MDGRPARRENPAHAFFDPAAENWHVPFHFAAEREGGGFVVVAGIEVVVPIDDDAVAVGVKCSNARAAVIRGREKFGGDGFHLAKKKKGGAGSPALAITS